MALSPLATVPSPALMATDAADVPPRSPEALGVALLLDLSAVSPPRTARLDSANQTTPTHSFLVPADGSDSATSIIGRKRRASQDGGLEPAAKRAVFACEELDGSVAPVVRLNRVRANSWVSPWVAW